MNPFVRTQKYGLEFLEEAYSKCPELYSKMPCNDFLFKLRKDFIKETKKDNHDDLGEI